METDLIEVLATLKATVDNLQESIRTLHEIIFKEPVKYTFEDFGKVTTPITPFEVSDELQV